MLRSSIRVCISFEITYSFSKPVAFAATAVYGFEGWVADYAGAV